MWDQRLGIDTYFYIENEGEGRSCLVNASPHLDRRPSEEGLIVYRPDRRIS